MFFGNNKAKYVTVIKPLCPADTSPKTGEEYELKKVFVLSLCVRGTTRESVVCDGGTFMFPKGVPIGLGKASEGVI